MITGTILTTSGVTLGAVGAGTDQLWAALAGFLVALTALVHAIVTERTRRQNKRVKPRIANTARRVSALERERDQWQLLADERGHAIDRLNHRVDSLMEKVPAADPDPPLNRPHEQGGPLTGPLD